LLVSVTIEVKDEIYETLSPIDLPRQCDYASLDNFVYDEIERVRDLMASCGEPSLIAIVFFRRGDSTRLR
jgi:hypothetical protein